VIGEAARQVSREFTAVHPEIPWENIVGMRHKVVHDYEHSSRSSHLRLEQADGLGRSLESLRRYS
jgi:uncharacterized protein with HEPN domain